MHRIETCRTAVLGGHLDVCDACGHTEVSYNSCRDRHCPKCQCLRQARWVAARLERVLPTHHFHVVFTVPQELKPLALHNRVRFFELLFAAAARTLLALGRDPRRLGGLLGVTAVLHTWTRTLTFHPHLHCIVTGGGLAPDATRWVAAPWRGRYLFPVTVVARLFRGKLLAALARARQRGQLQFAGPCAHLADPIAFARLQDDLYRKPWVVYCKPPFAGPEHVLAYLGRYTHRVALSNDRLLAVRDGRVRFRWRDYADGDRVKVMALDVDEFLRRFLLHVVPDGFVRIRHFGLLANRCRAAALAQCRALLAQPPPPIVPPESARDLMLRVTGRDLDRCPRCPQGILRRLDVLPPAPAPWDTS